MDAYGPPLPPGFKLPVSEDSDSDYEQPKKKAKIIGPQPPESLNKEQIDKEYSPERKEVPQTAAIIGPMLPGACLQNNDTNDDDDDEYDDDDGGGEVYGPLPPQTKQDYDIVKIIEKRASNMKNKLEMKDAPTVQSTQREEWMVVPDTSRRNQLGAISRCLAPGSKIEKKETDSYKNPEEDEKTTKELKKYNKSKRKESLLEIHQKKKKKEKKEKKSEPKEERKAFDRDEIAVRHFTKKQVNSVIDKAKYLNSRFAPGRSSQYL